MCNFLVDRNVHSSYRQVSLLIVLKQYYKWPDVGITLVRKYTSCEHELGKWICSSWIATVCVCAGLEVLASEVCFQLLLLFSLFSWILSRISRCRCMCTYTKQHCMGQRVGVVRSDSCFSKGMQPLADVWVLSLPPPFVQNSLMQGAFQEVHCCDVQCFSCCIPGFSVLCLCGRTCLKPHTPQQGSVDCETRGPSWCLKRSVLLSLESLCLSFLSVTYLAVSFCSSFIPLSCVFAGNLSLPFDHRHSVREGELPKSLRKPSVFI